MKAKYSTNSLKGNYSYHFVCKNNTYIKTLVGILNENNVDAPLK